MDQFEISYFVMIQFGVFQFDILNIFSIKMGSCMSFCARAI